MNTIKNDHPHRDMAVDERMVVPNNQNWDDTVHEGKTDKEGIQVVCLGRLTEWLYIGVLRLHRQK